MTTYERQKSLKSPARFHGNGYLVKISDVTSTKRLKCYCLEISESITMKFMASHSMVSNQEDLTAPYKDVTANEYMKYHIFELHRKIRFYD